MLQCIVISQSIGFFLRFIEDAIFNSNYARCARDVCY